MILEIFQDFHPATSLISERKYSQVAQTYPPNSITFFDWSNSFCVLIGVYLSKPYNLPCRKASILIGSGKKLEHVPLAWLCLLLKFIEQYRFVLESMSNGTCAAVLLGQKAIWVLS